MSREVMEHLADGAIIPQHLLAVLKNQKDAALALPEQP